MGRIFITGDKHGDTHSPDDYRKIEEFCKLAETTKDDVMIVLGDHGVHYDESWHDHKVRKYLAKLPITFVMIRGNHDMRPNKQWKEKYLSSTINGIFVQDPEADNVLYTKEFGWYIFGDMPAFIIGGAYSVDKYYRLEMQRCGNLNYRWFADEQLNEKEIKHARESLFFCPYTSTPFVVLSHTCPLNFKPTKGLLPGFDQDSVDETMEKFMDELYIALLTSGAPLARWYCGHWHIDETNEPIRFMYHDIEELKGTEPWRRVSTIQTIKQHTSHQTNKNGSI